VRSSGAVEHDIPGDRPALQCDVPYSGVEPCDGSYPLMPLQHDVAIYGNKKVRFDSIPGLLG
jgi:hypothetical protein